MTMLEMLTIPGMDGSKKLRKMQIESQKRNERMMTAQIIAVAALKKHNQSNSQTAQNQATAK